MIEFLFLDLDNTILDFDKAEYLALCKTLRHFGLEPSEQVCKRYHQINRMYWQRLERKELTRPQVLLGRFEMLFAEFGMAVDPSDCAKTYEGLLAEGHFFLPGAEASLPKLASKYRLYLASNGTARVQASRLESAAIGRYFEDIFISQEIGANKPDREFFDRCFARIPDFDHTKAMIVGDSLTSDILGGLQAGMKTCWINPHGLPINPEIPADYTLERLEQLYDLLENL